MTRAGWIIVGSIVAAGGIMGPSPLICLLPARAPALPVAFAAPEVPTASTALTASRGAAVPAGAVLAAESAVSGEPQYVRPFEDVVSDLESRDPKTRVNAMRTLGQAGHPEAIEHISRLLTDPVIEIQREAIETILGFYMLDLPKKTKRVAGLVEVNAGNRAEAAFDRGPFILLPRPSPDALKKGLAAAMRSDHPQIRLEATYTLGATVPPPAGPEAEAALAGNLRDPDAAIRLASARVAGAVRAASLGDALIAAINDSDARVVLAAMRAVGDIRERRAVQALEEQYAYYGRGPMARAAFDGLGRIGARESLPVFQQALADRDPAIRRVALEGIVRTNDLPAIEAATARLAGDKDRAIRLAHAFGMERITQRGPDALVGALGDDRLSEQAMAYLVELGPGVVPRLARFLNDPDPRVRERLVQTMGLLGGDAARAAIEPTTRDPDLGVKRAAERALARIRIIGLAQ